MDSVPIPTKLIIVLSELAKSGLVDVELGYGMKTLIASETWRLAEPNEKLVLLKFAYEMDYLAGSYAQRSGLIRLRIKVEKLIKQCAA